MQMTNIAFNSTKRPILKYINMITISRDKGGIFVITETTQ